MIVMHRVGRHRRRPAGDLSGVLVGVLLAVGTVAATVPAWIGAVL